MKREKKQLYLAILLILFGGLVNRYFYDTEVIHILPDIILLALTIKCFKKFKSAKRKFAFGVWLPYIYAFIIVFGTVSSIYHNINLLSILWGIRLTTRFSLLLVLIINIFEPSDVIKLKKWFYNTYYTCVMFCCIQFLQGQRGDLMGGIFEGNKELAAYPILIMFMSTGDYLQKRLSKERYFLIIVGFFVIAIMAEIKFLYFVMPISFYATYVLLRRFSAAHVMVLAFAFVGLIPSMQYVISIYYDDEYVENTFDQEYIEEEITHSYGFQKGGFNRSTAIAMTSEVINKTNIDFYVGHGIGSGSASSYFSGQIYEKYKYTTYHFFATSYILVELGWIGFLLTIFALYLLAYRFGRFYFRTKDSIVKYWAMCGILSALVTYIMAWYSSIPYTDYYFFYMFWGLCFVAIYERKRQLIAQRQ